MIDSQKYLGYNNAAFARLVQSLCVVPK